MPAAGIAWQFFCNKREASPGNWRAECKYCDQSFSGTHTRFAAHFNGDDSSVKTCESAPASCLTIMSEYWLSMANKAAAKERKRKAAALATADRVVKKQKRVTDICNRYSSDSLDMQFAAVFFRNFLPHSLADDALFNDFIKALRYQPESYKSPGRKQVGGTLLDKAYEHAKNDNEANAEKVGA